MAPPSPSHTAVAGAGNMKKECRREKDHFKRQDSRSSRSLSPLGRMPKRDCHRGTTPDAFNNPADVRKSDLPWNEHGHHHHHDPHQPGRPPHQRKLHAVHTGLHWNEYGNHHPHHLHHLHHLHFPQDSQADGQFADPSFGGPGHRGPKLHGPQRGDHGNLHFPHLRPLPVHHHGFRPGQSSDPTEGPYVPMKGKHGGKYRGGRGPHGLHHPHNPHHPGSWMEPRREFTEGNCVLIMDEYSVTSPDGTVAVARRSRYVPVPEQWYEAARTNVSA